MRRWGGLSQSRCNKPPITTLALSVLYHPGKESAPPCAQPIGFRTSEGSLCTYSSFWTFPDLCFLVCSSITKDNVTWHPRALSPHSSNCTVQSNARRDAAGGPRGPANVWSHLWSETPRSALVRHMTWLPIRVAPHCGAGGATNSAPHRKERVSVRVSEAVSTRREHMHVIGSESNVENAKRTSLGPCSFFMTHQSSCLCCSAKNGP